VKTIKLPQVFFIDLKLMEMRNIIFLQTKFSPSCLKLFSLQLENGGIFKNLKVLDLDMKSALKFNIKDSDTQDDADDASADVDASSLIANLRVFCPILEELRGFMSFPDAIFISFLSENNNNNWNTLCESSAKA